MGVGFRQALNDRAADEMRTNAGAGGGCLPAGACSGLFATNGKGVPSFRTEKVGNASMADCPRPALQTESFDLLTPPIGPRRPPQLQIRLGAKLGSGNSSGPRRQLSSRCLAPLCR